MIWNGARILFSYRQKILVFSRRAASPMRPLDGTGSNPRASPLDLVHSELHLEAAEVRGGIRSRFFLPRVEKPFPKKYEY